MGWVDAEGKRSIEILDVTSSALWTQFYCHHNYPQITEIEDYEMFQSSMVNSTINWNWGREKST